MTYYAVPIYWRIRIVTIADDRSIYFLTDGIHGTLGFSTLMSNSISFETVEEAREFMRIRGQGLSLPDEMPQHALLRAYDAMNYGNTIDERINNRLNPRVESAASNPPADALYLVQNEVRQRILEL